MQVDARLNNFDLIRLVAAGQVVLWHGIEHLKIEVPAWFLWLLGSFPGVPIFFVVSGFLVAASYRRRRSLGGYFANRALRIFPGLWVCFALTLASIAWLHGIGRASLSDLVLWIGPNLVGLSRTPWFLKDYATGSVNGSLWTIPVELQFYVALPVLLWLLGSVGWRWVIGFGTALVCGAVYLLVLRPAVQGLLQDALLRALPSWLYMFMLGMILEARADWIRRWLEGRVLIWLVAYLAWIMALTQLGVWTRGNDASPLSLIPLAGVVVAAAYTGRSLAERLLHGNDVSYGIYLYHMPVINALIASGLAINGWMALALCTGLTSALAIASWRWVERPALRLKPKSPQHPVTSVT